MTATRLKTIMLIDDEDVDNMIHARLIRRAGIAAKIEVFNYARDALAYLNTAEPGSVDLIFLDINMPGMNGFEFLDAYGALSAEHRATAVIMMLTTSLNPKDVSRAEKTGMLGGYLNKPLTEEMLRQVMSELDASQSLGLASWHDNAKASPLNRTCRR